MKKIFAVLIVALVVSCTLPAPQIEPGEVLIDGVWGGWVIAAGGMQFSTPIGIKTIGYHIQVVQHDRQWYVWENGYGMQIELASASNK